MTTLSVGQSILMRNKENRKQKKSQQKSVKAQLTQRSFSLERPKRSNFSSLIFESGRNSLCSPKGDSVLHPQDKYHNYMHYITSGKIVQDCQPSRASHSKPKSVTPTPRRPSTSLLDQGRKSVIEKQNPRGEKLKSKSKPESRSPQGKPLFVKGSNIVKADSQSRKKPSRPQSTKKNKGTATAAEDQREKKLLERLFQGIQFHRDLGRGAHALVKSGVDWNNKRKIAVKIYEKGSLKSEQLRSIEREIEILGSLNHPSIIKLYEIIQSFRTINLVMEYGGGNSVEQYLHNKKTGKLEEDEARNIFRDIAQGIAYLHEKKVAHRDIKADNVLLNKYLKVKIIDFGFSLQLTQPSTLVTTHCGTPTHMPPEVTSKLPYDPILADRWALGILLYSLLHGSCPFRAQNQKELFVKICEGTYQCGAHVSNDAKQLIASFLKMKPQARISPKEALSSRWLGQV